MKDKALANLLAERYFPNKSSVESNASWSLYVDELASNEGSGAGLIVVSSKGHTYTHVLNFMFKASNNEDECEAVLVGMEIYNVLETEYLKALSNSQLVVS